MDGELDRDGRDHRTHDAGNATRVAAWHPGVGRLLAQQIPGFSIDHRAARFTELGVDSFDMVELRLGVEQLLGHALPDAVWLALRSPAELMAALSSSSIAAQTAPAADAALRRDYVLNMPHMALTGLSESWLCKELGDAHWAMITEGLGVASSELRDGQGDRLYATFTRLRFTATGPLSGFVENEATRLTGRIERSGAGLFFSEQTLAGATTTISASVMSSFARRGMVTSNTSLQKGQPPLAATCRIVDRGAMPELGAGYRARRAAVTARGAPLAVLYERDYDILPYHDINGVGLLYFAAYPMISDLCELSYRARGNAWAMQASTVARDICYFANCDANDVIVYRVHACREPPGAIELETSLTRKSDGALMAYLITRKEVRVA
ncbi:MAG: Pnap_2097 family protein [Kofleriaceae bacterium]